MQQEKFELDERFGKEYAGRYIFGEITWAKRNRIIQKYTRYHPVSGHVVSTDFVAIQAETIWACLKEQPTNRPITLEKLLDENSGIPIGLGELFSQIVNRLNNVDTDEAAFLSEQSEEANQTKPSQTSACAKNSDGHRPSSQGNQQRPSSNSSSSST